MIVEVIEKPVTFRAVQIVKGVYTELDELLRDTPYDVSYKALAGSQILLQHPRPDYATYGYVEGRSNNTLWGGDWVVVSSVGEVRHLTDEEFKKEFETV